MKTATETTIRGANGSGSRELIYIYVAEDGTDSSGPLSPAQATLDDVAFSKSFSESLKFSKSSVEALPFLDTSIRRYSRWHLKNILQFMGFKSHLALDVTEAIYKTLQKNFEKKKLPEKHRYDDGVHLPKAQFWKIVRCALATFQFSKPETIRDFEVACGIQDRRYSFTILLGGTSGCGKSTLASLLASRIGFTTVISTDHVRHMLRSFVSKDQSPVLWSSTYHASEAMTFAPDTPEKEKIIQGWEAQNELLVGQLDDLITRYETRRESLIIEGVHLSSKVVSRLMEKHPTCIPFLVYISNKEKHKERFAVRAKYMTIDPRHNKYVKYIKNIRVISDYLCRTFDRHLIPKIDNTNIDRSLATIHSIIFCCIRRNVNNREPFWDSRIQQAVMVQQEFEKQAFYSSARMLQYLEMKAQQQAAKINEPEPGSDEEKEEGIDSHQSDYFDEGSLGS
jgi:2-phosphoglycerate kinase